MYKICLLKCYLLYKNLVVKQRKSKFDELLSEIALLHFSFVELFKKSVKIINLMCVVHVFKLSS